MRLTLLLSHLFLLFLLIPSIIAGSESSFSSLGNNDTIKIGLLISSNSSAAALHGAEMAVSETNKSGGINGHPLLLKVRSMEGLWGTGSKQAVDLIFKEEVWAILGSHDGRNAHLAEQATAKTRVVFMSAWAGDPTLSQAFVPWYFSCVPNSNQQAEILLQEIYKKKKYNNLSIVSDSSYDSETGMKSLVNKITAEKKPKTLYLRNENLNNSLAKLTRNIKSNNTDCIIVFASHSSTVKLIRKLREDNINIPVICSHTSIDERELTGTDLENSEGVMFISSGHWFTSKGLTFRKEFQKLYGYLPGPAAAYSYDGMSMLIEAIRKAEPVRENIQKQILSLQYNGVTGTISFDEKGNRKGPFHLMIIKDSKPVLSQ